MGRGRTTAQGIRLGPRLRGKGREGCDPCWAHKTVLGWMRIQWARATGLLAARWGINTG